MCEIWKYLDGKYSNYYQISNIGNIRSLDRYVNGRYGKQLKKGILMKPYISNWGYKCIRLHTPIRKHVSLHVLIAKAFIPNPHGLLVVDHVDGNKLNNNINNLEWVTQSENMNRSVKLGLSHSGKSHVQSKPVLQFDINGKFINEFDNAAKASIDTGTCKASIYKVCTNTRNIANNFKWEYKK